MHRLGREIAEVSVSVVTVGTWKIFVKGLDIPQKELGAIDSGGGWVIALEVEVCGPVCRGTWGSVITGLDSDTGGERMSWKIG
jgi:hypothetical protein